MPAFDTRMICPRFLRGHLPTGCDDPCSSSEIEEDSHQSTAIVADELEADWNRVVISRPLGIGVWVTRIPTAPIAFVCSLTVCMAVPQPGRFERAAANKWSVEADWCYAENHWIKHKAAIARWGWRVVADANCCPFLKKANCNSNRVMALHWKRCTLTDVDDIVTSRQYSVSMRVDNQLFAVITRPPVVGGKVESFDATEARQMPGVVDVIEIPPFKGAPMFQPLGGVAVLATSTWAAWQGRDSLEIQWNDGDNAFYDSQDFAVKCRKRPSNPARS